MEKIVNLFPVPIMLVDMSDVNCKEKLIEIIDSSEKIEHGLVPNGVSSFETMPILHHPELEELKIKIEQHINKYAKCLGIGQLVVQNNWFNIMDEGSKVKRHNHEASVISGAYYPRAPEGSSKLHFINPLKPFRMTEIHTHQTPYSCFDQDVECLEDLMILFPSWLEHYTNENTTQKRTVVSFNTKSKFADQNFEYKLDK
jgi:uncharacterized protein (TIGR02466 family)